ncbi:MAG: hypothetical protein AAGB31_11810 [Bdellovibrio sp.]
MSKQDVANIKIKPMYVYLSADSKQTEQVTCVADVEGSLFGNYFALHTPAGENHAVYLDDATVVDSEDYLLPVLPGSGWTATRVAIAEDDSATAIAGKIKTALLAVSGSPWTVVQSGKVLIITHATEGYAHPARDAIKTAKKTGFSFAVKAIGFAEISLGAIEGDIQLTGMEQNVKEVQTHATGETVQSEITTGYSKPELGFSLMEFDKAAIKRAMVMVGGQTMLPEIEDAEEVVGYGMTLMGGSKPTFKLRLHPVALDDADTSEDITFWKAAIGLESFTFSGTEFSTIPVTASIYPDSTKPKSIEFFSMGSTEWLSAI